MISLIKHVLRVAHSVVREHTKKLTRSSKWSGVRKAALKASPSCAACKYTKLLQVHHISSFHLHPELELDPKNLTVLCMGPNECHLLIGHGHAFTTLNPYLAADLLNIQAGTLSLTDAQINAKKNAIKNEG